LTPGRIIYLLDLPLTQTTKNKYAIVAGDTDPPLLLVMGRHIPQMIAHDPDRRARQVLLPASDYPCLTDDSYLDCTRVITTMTMDEIKDQLVADVSQLGEVLSQGHLKQIRDAVTGARTLTTDEQTAIIQTLRGGEAPPDSTSFIRRERDDRAPRT